MTSFDGRHPGVARFTAEQQQFADAFRALRPQRAWLNWPPGSGKTMVAAAIADLACREGPVLVVTPAVSVPHWSDLLRQLQRSDPISHERSVAIFDQSSMEWLRRLRGLSTGGASFGTSQVVLVVSLDSASKARTLELLSSVPWRLVVVDEAQRIRNGPDFATWSGLLAAGDASLVIGPDQRSADALPSHVEFSWSGDTRGAEAVRVHSIQAWPSEAESLFVQRVAEWAEMRGDYVGRLALRLALVNPLATVNLLERVAGAESEAAEFATEEGAIDIELPPSGTGDGGLPALLELADGLEPPGSKTLRTVDLLLEPSLGSRPVLAVATLLQDAVAIEQAVLVTGRPVESVSASMEPDERLASAARIRGAGGVLISTSASLSGSMLDGFDLVVHRDAGFNSRSTGRTVELLSPARRQEVNILVVRWPREIEDLGGGETVPEVEAT